MAGGGAPSGPFPVPHGLRARAVDAVEEMDRPDCDPRRLERTYAQFRVVNAVVAGWRRLYATRLRPLLAGTANPTLLDVGCGGGDVARALARWAARDRLRLDITAVDPDGRALAFAARQPPLPGLVFRRAGTAELVAEGARFDVVVSNHVLHHLDEAALRQLLVDSEELCRGAAFHSDISRSPAAYALFSAGTLPFFPGSYIRRDGLTSIRRSYTAAELRAAVPPDWTVERDGPFRNLLVFRAESGPDA
ncbi:class I SAM-dependent methyltransferase [Specibacter cremeus]|uniref:class I SAM-dependent methyltransferase n=1 Tax=Specibacter cremeus TaxID=1629051 RepID=UPI000F7A6E3F|nr:class I SAM-dependent methyltransferase [Specibacter cremeus]